MKKDFPIKMLLFGKCTDLTINAFCLQSNHSHTQLSALVPKHLCEFFCSSFPLFSPVMPQAQQYLRYGGPAAPPGYVPFPRACPFVPGSLMERSGVAAPAVLTKPHKVGFSAAPPGAPESIPCPSRERSWRAIV